jgi:hypothetical protein
LLYLLNPTINIQAGDIKRIPIPSNSSDQLDTCVEEAIRIAQDECAEIETTYDFISPSEWIGKGQANIERQHQLEDLETKINAEIYGLYGLSEKDIYIIELECDASMFESDDDNGVGGLKINGNEEEVGGKVSFILEDIARKWLSYAVGIAIGRFQPGVEGALGRGNFSDGININLQALVDPDGIMVMDEGHPDDLPARTFECLTVMLGATEAANAVRAAIGKDGPPEERLQNYLDKNFFKEHIQLYRKRPVYWLFQSPKKKYGVWVFHERMTKDTLFRIRTEYVEPKIRLLESQLEDLKSKSASVEGRELRQMEKEISDLSDVLDDVTEFAKLIKKVTDKGYKHHIDDGVLINLAPLWELMPSWQTEPKNAWKKLEKGDWDWSYQPMDHWPDRVKEKCKKNKSYAIAHGLESLYEG